MRGRAARPGPNGTETGRKYDGRVQVIERQTQNGRSVSTERNGNVTVFMPPTVYDSDTKANSAEGFAQKVLHFLSSC